MYVQAFASISLASSGLLVSPPRSCDRLDDDHMTAVVRHRWGKCKHFLDVCFSNAAEEWCRMIVVHERACNALRND